MSEFHFIEPLDVLYLRGNRLFADASTPSEAIMPPWPSVAAGAIRSQILAQHKIDVGQYANNQLNDDSVKAALGTPQTPGAFRLSHWLLAKCEQGQITDVYLPLPADVISLNEQQQIEYLQPRTLHAAISHNAPCTQLPVFKTAAQAKPDNGLWLNSKGINAWRKAEPLTQEHLAKTDELWKIDARLGIALEGAARTTIDGQLYTVDAVDMHPNLGFIAGISGAKQLLADRGILRFGGDGRGAAHSKIDWTMDNALPESIASDQRFRLMLTSPGLFAQGWLLPGMEKDGQDWLWKTQDFSARLVSASIARAETISGWDVANNTPKPALKAAGCGSIYWFDQFQGDKQALDKLVKQGLSAIGAYPDAKRIAEGFNSIMLAAWPLQH